MGHVRSQNRALFNDLRPYRKHAAILFQPQNSVIMHLVIGKIKWLVVYSSVTMSFLQVSPCTASCWTPKKSNNKYEQ